MPVYNAVSTLDEAVASVLDQTFRDLEILIVDDGSKDGSLNLAHRMEAGHPGVIRVLTHAGCANRGVAASRNLALDHSSGRYIAFLDADDVWFPKKLERQLQEFANAGEGIGLVFSDICNMRAEPGADLNASERWDPGFSAAFLAAQGSTAERMLFGLAQGFQNLVASPTPLVRAAYFRDGLRFVGPPRLNTQFEDYLMWLALSLKCEFRVIPEPLAYYRVHHEQFVSRYCRSTTCLGYLLAMEELLQILQEDCRLELDKLDWCGRLGRRFNEVALRMIAGHRRLPSNGTSALPIADYLGILRLGVRRAMLFSAARALTSRTLNTLMAPLVENRVINGVRNRLRRVGYG